MRRFCMPPILIVAGILSLSCLQADEPAQPFGPEFPRLDSDATGEWWKPRPITTGKRKGQTGAPRLLVPRDEVMAFAVYTHDQGILKLSAQLYPLKPDEPRTVTLEFYREGKWQVQAEEPVIYPGWSAHFRVENWDGSSSVRYRVRLQNLSNFEGVIRRDPSEKDEIRVAVLSCNSSRTPGPRETIVDNLRAQDPDLLFFAGDQSYHHTQHTFGWIEWGMQFRDVLRDRPTVTIPDDHDVGHPNIWGENGIRTMKKTGSDGGYYYPAAYVNMVERCQTWHLPDPVDPEPIQQGIGVYFTRLRVGGIDFAILEDRKFKTGPEGTIPPLGPRPDHINDPSYDRKAVDLPGLQLLGERQMKFLQDWSQDWKGADIKCVLSQTAFCGAVHLHGSPNNRLLADLDCNGWPQTPRRDALRLLRQARALHLCGDQHLAVVVQHGIDEFGDGPWGFTSPAIVNTIYGRWWHPENEQAGPNAVPDSPLPWTGDYLDGLGNQIRMVAYANPEDRMDEMKRSDGYGIVRFHRSSREIVMECWPRFSRVEDGDRAQFPGWPVTISVDDNDGRKPAGWLPNIRFSNAKNAVVQVISEQSGEILYTVRTPGKTCRLPVYGDGTWTVRIGRDQPGQQVLTGLKATDQPAQIDVNLP